MDKWISLIKAVTNGIMTGGAMWCIWNLEHEALSMGINGSQFMYVVAAIGLLGGVTLAPLIEIVKKMSSATEVEPDGD